MRLRINTGEEKMTDLIEKIKGLKTATKLIIAFFVVAMLANMLGYGA